MLDGSGTFSTSALVTGNVYAANYSAPTPATLTTAVSAMEAAYTDGATRPAGVGASNLNLGGGTLSGHNLVPGTYTWGSNVSITNDITFTGSASDIWILQISGNLSIEANKKILLTGGALPSNIFWVVAGTTTLKPGSTFQRYHSCRSAPQRLRCRAAPNCTEERLVKRMLLLLPIP